MDLAQDILRTYIEYTDWANKAMLEACSKLKGADLELDLGTSHGNILHLLRHTYLSERAWRDRLLKDELPPLPEIGRPELFSGNAINYSLDDLEKYWPEIPQSLLAWLSHVNDAYLNGEMLCSLPEGGSLRTTRAEILLHNLNHSSIHRGQVISMIRMHGMKPPNLDVFSYYMVRD